MTSAEVDSTLTPAFINSSNQFRNSVNERLLPQYNCLVLTVSCIQNKYFKFRIKIFKCNINVCYITMNRQYIADFWGVNTSAVSSRLKIVSYIFSLYLGINYNCRISNWKFKMSCNIFRGEVPSRNFMG